MDRRQFLENGSTLAVVLPLAGFPAWTDPNPNRTVLSRPETLTRLGDSGLLRRLGCQYRAAFPEENDPDRLREILGHEAGSVKRPTSRARLQTRIRLDFAEGRTVVLKGWILARTEARQCALASFSFPPTGS